MMHKHLLSQFRFHHRLYNNVLEGSTDEKTNLRLKWNDLFTAMDQSEAKDDILYPSVEEIKAEWNALYKPIGDKLVKLSPEDLNEIPPKPLDKVFANDDIIENTIGGFLAFLNHHQAYHIGQIGFLRKGLGKKPMSYQRTVIQRSGC